MKRVIFDAEDVAFELYCKEKAMAKSRNWKTVMRSHFALQKAYKEFRKRHRIVETTRLLQSYIYQKRLEFDSRHTDMIRAVIRFCYYERLRRGSDLALDRIVYRYFEALISRAYLLYGEETVGWYPPMKILWPGKRNKAVFFDFVSDPKNIRVEREEYWRPMLRHRFEDQRRRWVAKWIWKNQSAWREIAKCTAPAL